MVSDILNNLVTTQKDFLSFKLSDSFVDKYKDKEAPLGYADAAGNSIGEIILIDKYSRLKPDGSKERWYEVCKRVIDGTYSIQKDWAKNHSLPWNNNKAQRSAEEAYDLLFNLYWSPPGRGLSAMGSYVVNGMKNSMPLQNCSVISTADMIKTDPAYPFCFLMDVGMLGVGIGTDIRGAAKGFTIYTPDDSNIEIFVVPDTREGWVESLRKKINSYLVLGRQFVKLNTSLIRREGSAIKTFGGIAPGPKPLEKLMSQLDRLFENRNGELLTEVDIADIVNMVGVCIISGNVRRMAELILGEYSSKQFLNLKNPQIYPERNNYSDPTNPGWGFISNNTVIVTPGQTYDDVISGITRNGEPGLLWLDNIHNFGRIKDGIKTDDHRVVGANPCQPSWATVATTEGISTIGDISVGDNIWSGKQWTRIINKWSTGIKHVYAYRTAGGTFYGTQNHRVVSRGEKIEALYAKEIDCTISPHSPNTFDNDEAWVDTTYTFPILAKDYISTEEVFDITVDNEEHVYWTNGTIVSNCSEQFLESGECCTLADLYISKIPDEATLRRAIKYAFLYAKTVTLLPTHLPKTNAIMQRNRRIGLSVSGVTDFMDNRGRATLRKWLDQGYTWVNEYDQTYSEWLCVRESIRKTTTKPGGTTGLLVGVPPGGHWTPGGMYFWRLMRLPKSSLAVKEFISANYRVEPALESPDNTVVVYFPIKSQSKRSEREVSLYEKASLAVDLQTHWSDNGVSVTLSFDPEKETEDVQRILEMYDGSLKSVSFLPLGGVYPQSPYIPMTSFEYEEAKTKLKKINISLLYENGKEAEGESGCTTDACEVSWMKK